MFQSFDNTFADIAERSDIVGIDRNADRFHALFSAWPSRVDRIALPLYMTGTISYLAEKSSTYYLVWYLPKGM
jgi:hypothetical protein